MARTLAEIYNELTLTKESNPELDALLPNPDNYSQLFTEDNFRLLANTVLTNLSVSLVAVWRLFIYVAAFGIWSLENLMDVFKAEVESTIIDNQYGQIRWYPTVSKQFQLGDQLEFIDLGKGRLKFHYPTIDASKQIVTQAAATLNGSQIILKVAKGILPDIVPLSSAELTSFVFYIKGTDIEIISSESDNLKFAIDIFYDPLVLANDGSSLATPTENPVQDAIYNFINELPFDSIFQVIKLVDAIQAVIGVNNVVVNNCDAKSAGDATFTNVLAQIGQQYTTFSGYLRMNTGNDLDEEYAPGVPTLNFIES